MTVKFHPFREVKLFTTFLHLEKGDIERETPRAFKKIFGAVSPLYGTIYSTVMLLVGFCPEASTLCDRNVLMASFT